MPIVLGGNRRIEIEDGVWFEMRSEQFTDWAKAAQFARTLGAEIKVDEEGKPIQDRITNVIIGGYALLTRIIAWGGIVDQAGNDLECNETNLLALFGQRPDLMNVIGEQVTEKVAVEEKNSEASQDS